MFEQHSPPPPSTSITKTTTPDIKEYKQKFRVHFAEMVGYGRKTVSEGWFAGEALNKIKARLPHGAFRLFLEAEGVNRETGRRLMRLHRGVQIAKLVSFASVDAALKSIPSKVSNPYDETSREPTAAEIDAIEAEQWRARAERSEAEALEVRRELETIQERQAQDDPVAVMETEMATERARASDTRTLLDASRNESRKLKRRLSAVKRALIEGMSRADVLALHFGVAVPGQAQLQVLDKV